MSGRVKILQITAGRVGLKILDIHLCLSDVSLPRLRTKFGERSFSRAGRSAWNCLPEDLRAVADAAKFRQQPKT